MPLPLVSLNTIESTTSTNEDQVSFVEVITEQPLLTLFLKEIVSNLPEDITPVEALWLGALTVYKMLERQVEAEDML